MHKNIHDVSLNWSSTKRNMFCVRQYMCVNKKRNLLWGVSSFLSSKLLPPRPYIWHSFALPDTTSPIYLGLGLALQCSVLHQQDNLKSPITHAVCFWTVRGNTTITNLDHILGWLSGCTVTLQSEPLGGTVWVIAVWIVHCCFSIHSVVFL